MLNLLGDIWPPGGVPPWAEVLALPGTHLHLYGKQQVARGRKMGHLTVTAATVEEVRSTALQAAARAVGVKVTCIGRFARGKGVHLAHSGRAIRPASAGYTHF